ncbi:MAG TPA: DUF3592 domain-containing protein [Luteolibacter sp.]
MANSTLAGRLFLAAIGLSLALAGAFFCWLMGRSFARAHEMRAWPQVPCVVLQSEVEERQIDPNSPAETRFKIEYGYEWQGKPLAGERWTWRGSPWSSERAKAEELVALYPVGSRSACYVNPQQPDFAVLKPDSQAPGYSIWFPALFVVGGLGIAFRALVKKSPA